jgi:hypothetical protein
LGPKQQLQEIARLTGGNYFPANNAGELLAALTKVLQFEYAVLDSQGNEVGHGKVGGKPVKAKAGTYKLRVFTDKGPLDAELAVQANQKTSMVLKRQEKKWLLVTPNP